MRRRVGWVCVTVVGGIEVLAAAGALRHASAPVTTLVESLLLGSFVVLGSTLVYGAWLAALVAPVALAVARSPSAFEPVGVLVLLLETAIVYGAFVAAGAAMRGAGELTVRPRPRRARRSRAPGRAVLAVAVALAGALAFKATILDAVSLGSGVATGGLVLVTGLLLYAMRAQGRGANTGSDVSSASAWTAGARR
jgi:hypothetical protein